VSWEGITSSRNIEEGTNHLILVEVYANKFLVNMIRNDERGVSGDKNYGVTAWDNRDEQSIQGTAAAVQTLHCWPEKLTETVRVDAGEKKRKLSGEKRVRLCALGMCFVGSSYSRCEARLMAGIDRGGECEDLGQLSMQRDAVP
jgi:hypothetical protein